MQIAPETKVHDLLDTYPFLLDFLAELKPEFGKLKNPVLRNTIGRVATLATVAEMGDMETDVLIVAIKDDIARHKIHAGDDTSAAEGGRGGSTESAPADEAARARRQKALKSIIRKLHDGASVDDVKAEFDALTSEIDAAEIAAMEQALIAEGMAVEEVQRLCDVHVSVFRESLDANEQKDAYDVQPGHPVDTYRRENAVAGEMLASLRCSVEQAESVTAEEADSLRETLAEDLQRLLDGIAVHYIRKENQLFPLLERHGIEGPTKVMWGLDDDIRARLKNDLVAVRMGETEKFTASLPATLGMVEDMIYKEEKILFPAALKALNEAEWEAMAAGEAEIGFAWIDPPSRDEAEDAAAAGIANAGSELSSLPLTTGVLSLEQIDLMVRVLPFDITFVDENDRVRFYSEGDRVFPRSPAVIGREVKNCHPPQSVATVEKILSAFKHGSQDVSEFWIELGGKFIHIRYYALRDADGAYRGCLEVVQDATHVRGLEGERRLLDWE